MKLDQQNTILVGEILTQFSVFETESVLTCVETLTPGKF